MTRIGMVNAPKRDKLTKGAEAIARPYRWPPWCCPSTQAVRKRALRLRHARHFCDAAGVVRDGAVDVDGEAYRNGTEQAQGAHTKPNMPHRLCATMIVTPKHSTGAMQEK